jgi:Protein of unknown function (DUF3071)
VQELRFVAVSEDGSYAVLAIPGRSGRYILPIDERLRAVALGQTSRLAQYEIEVESPLRPKEIQARIRAGETAEEIADAAGIPVERVRWFEGPVLAERAYIAEQAQAGSVRRAGDSSGPGPRLGEIVTARLTAAGTDPADGQWDSRKRGDGSWQVSLTFPSGGRLHVAEWVFDPRRRHVMPDDDNAARLSLPESELPPEPVAVPGEATVTPIAPRLGAAAGMGGGGYAAGPAVSRFRPERSVLPDRSLGADRSLADRPAPPAAPAGAPPERHAAADRPQAPAAPPPAAPSARPAKQDRPGYQDRRVSAGYTEFPESAPYRAPEPSDQQGQHRAEDGLGHDDPAAAAYRAQPADAGYRETGDRETGADQRAYREPAADEDPAPRPPAFHDAPPEPAAYRAQAPSARATVPPASGAPASGAAGSVPPAADGPASGDAERERHAPPRQVVFEDPEPTFLGGEHAYELDDVDTADAGTGPTTAQAPAAPAAAPAEPAASARTAAAAAEEAPASQAASASPASPASPAASATPTAAEAPATAPEAAPAAAGPEPSGPADTEDASGRPRPGAKKTAKGRRSSVPSWDEIMLGSSRPRD